MEGRPEVCGGERMNKPESMEGTTMIGIVDRWELVNQDCAYNPYTNTLRFDLASLSDRDDGEDWTYLQPGDMLNRQEGRVMQGSPILKKH